MNARSLLIARSVGVIGGTAALIVGATFAASVGNATLTGNTFAASQGIQISNGGAYGDTATGYAFGTTPIGGTGSAHQTFFLKDISGGATPLTVSVFGTNCGAFTNLNKAKVHVNVKPTSGGTTNSGTIADICAATPTPFALAASSSPSASGTQYDVWVTMDAGAITTIGGTDTASNSFDLNFTGDDGI